MLFTVPFPFRRSAFAMLVRGARRAVNFFGASRLLWATGGGVNDPTAT